MIRGYYLGCPGWALKTWVGRLFPPGTRPGEFLERYAEVFNTVEGNTTFYALPSADTVLRWRSQVSAEFRFCFKFPRAVTHDKLLVDCDTELAELFARLAPLEDRLGTLLLQLPPAFGPAHLDRLDALLASLPRAFRYAVEVRHPALFAGERDRLDALLAGHRADVVMLDTRGIRAGTSLEHAETRARKPNLPVIPRATAQHPFIRFVPHEVFAESRSLAESWADHVAAWIREGQTPYVFLHAPDDTFAPDNAYAFHALLAARADVGKLPERPGAPRQQSLL
jgi:uncharacterized protein YecE (DUF72 family)